MLDVEVNLNGRPPTYIEEDLRFVLTLNSIREISSYQMILQKRKKSVITGRSKQRYLCKYKEADWKKRAHEYLAALRERDMILVIKKNQ